jgi:hypothetical protein
MQQIFSQLVFLMETESDFLVEENLLLYIILAVFMPGG